MNIKIVPRVVFAGGMARAVMGNSAYAGEVVGVTNLTRTTKETVDHKFRP